MLPEPVRRMAEDIGSDTRSGALPLAIRALDAYSGLKGHPDPATGAHALHDLLRRGQPWMAAVVNASTMGRDLALSAEWDALVALGERLRRARRDVAAASRDILQDVRAVLTLSYSSDVLEALTTHRGGAHSLRTFVCESRPLNEGVTLARELRKSGVEAVVIADAAGPSIVSRCDAVITGADTLLRDGQLVNKIGTLGIALASEEYHVPYYPLMEVFKVELEGQEIPWQEESRDPEEICDQVEALNFYFERIPSGLLRSAVTDAGVLEVSEVLRQFKREEDLKEFYLRD